MGRDTLNLPDKILLYDETGSQYWGHPPWYYSKLITEERLKLLRQVCQKRT